jgi:hypothetical protein
MEESAIKKSGGGRISMNELEGRWRIERLSGVLPPMIAVHKEVRGERGETRFGPLPGPPYGIEEREDCLALVYRPPFSMLVDEVRRESEDSWLGRATLGGRTFGRFRMTRVS